MQNLTRFFCFYFHCYIHGLSKPMDFAQDLRGLNLITSRRNFRQVTSGDRSPNLGEEWHYFEGIRNDWVYNPHVLFVFRFFSGFQVDWCWLDTYPPNRLLFLLQNCFFLIFRPLCGKLFIVQGALVINRNPISMATHQQNKTIFYIFHHVRTMEANRRHRLLSKIRKEFLGALGENLKSPR